MTKRIVVALGGNAILVDDPSEKAQKATLKTTSAYLAHLLKEGHELVITHGNGPQVGNLLLQQEAADSLLNPAMSIDTCVGMTQGSIGYWLQNALTNELTKINLEKNVVSLVTQVVVDEKDPAFLNPSKPIGPFLTKEESEKRAELKGEVYMEDAGRGYRRVVPSPKPADIIEKNVIAKMLESDVVVIAGGGGGVPVIKNEDGTYEGVEGVIDKDHASQKLAELVNADIFIILTGVTHVAINYNKPGQRSLKQINLNELKNLRAQGHFAPGSMLPKVDAAIAFVEKNPSKKAVITSLENLPNVFGDNAGTVIVG